MSYVLGNNTPYDYKLYTTGGSTATIDFASLVSTNSADNYVIITDISNTVQGTYTYHVNGVDHGTITNAMCPFLISDIDGLADISCNVTFTPSENRDGYGSIFYYTISRYTPIVKKQIRQISLENTIIDEVINNTYGYEPFQKMSTQLYCYSSILEPDRIILLNTATTTDISTYFNTIGVPVLHRNGTLNLTWTPVIDEIGYKPKDTTVYDNTAYYYQVPLILEYFEDGAFTTYTNKNLIVVYDNSFGSVYTYNPTTRTTGVLVGDDGVLVGGGALEPGRFIEILRNQDGTLATPERVYYPSYADLVYKPYQYKQTFQHTNNPPTIAGDISIEIDSYNIETIGSSLGTTVASIIESADMSYADANAEYDRRGLIIGSPTQYIIQGNWSYRIEGETAWTTMNFSDENLNTLYWYLPEKKIVGGANKDVYVKFITNTNANGSAALVVYGWDRTNTVGPVEGPEAYELIPYSENGTVSENSSTIRQKMVKINYPPTYDNTIGDSYITVKQDTTVDFTFDNTFFRKIGFLDVFGPGPGVGLVLEDICGGGIGSWEWRYQNDSSWTPFNFSGGLGFHVKQYESMQDNVLVRFVPDKYKFGIASFRARLWDTSVDVLNGTYSAIPAIHDPFGAYSIESKKWNIVIENIADPPKIYDGSGVEYTEMYTKKFITYGQGFTPEEDGSDSITVSSILEEFAINRIFEARLINVDNQFVDFEKPALGIAIEDVSGLVDVSFQLLLTSGNWRTYSISDFITDSKYRFLHLNYRDKFRFRVQEAALGSIAIRFRIWNRLNVSEPSLSSSIASYNTFLSTGPYYSIPITATIAYDDTNRAPIINNIQSTYSYSLGIQSEDSGDSVDFDIGDIIENLLSTVVGGQPLITDVDGAYITQIPLFGLALCEAPAPNGFPNAGTWKYREDANASAQTLDFSRGFFHVAPGNGVQPKIFYSPTKHTYGPIQLVARVWDRSNETDVSAGMYRSYTGKYDRIAPYSAKTLTFQLTITNVNDQPYVVSGKLRLPTIAYTNGNNTGNTLYNIMYSNQFIIADPDPQDIGSHGIAITSASADRFGKWQYRITANDWIDIPDEPFKALHLDPLINDVANSNVALRYVPNADLPSRIRTGVRIFQFYLWDKSNNVRNGEFTPISPSTDSAYSLIVYNGRVSVI